ncbi:MAG: 3-oxoacyl-ACP reductase [Thiotrichales bacterium]|mgnify:CR=1 FL=1|nr:3-oxoacyl-ACP reductase [Thiotrichales bacterium]
MIELNGKIALVTGGSRGIGAATVRQWVGAGGRAIIHYGSSRDAAEALADEVGRSNVVLVQADVGSVEDTERLWSDALSHWEHIDVLVNNAGIYEVNDLSWDLDRWLEGWRRTQRINLESAAQLCRAALPHFIGNGAGVVINVASRAAHRGDDINHLQYGASKAGMLALNRAIARACGSKGVLAYGVAPGFVLTDMVDYVVKEKGLEAMSQMYPTGRVTTPEEVASVIVFCGSGVSPQTTGNTIDLSGGADVR